MGIPQQAFSFYCVCWDFVSSIYHRAFTLGNDYALGRSSNQQSGHDLVPTCTLLYIGDQKKNLKKKSNSGFSLTPLTHFYTFHIFSIVLTI